MKVINLLHMLLITVIPNGHATRKFLPGMKHSSWNEAILCPIKDGLICYHVLFRLLIDIIKSLYNIKTEFLFTKDRTLWYIEPLKLVSIHCAMCHFLTCIAWRLDYAKILWTLIHLLG